MLREELSTVSGLQRKFLLLRIADIDKSVALKLCKVTESGYNHWTMLPEFQAIYHRRTELSSQFKDEAALLLRDENYIAIVALEGEMIQRIREEIVDGKPVFAKTHLGREVYSKLAAELSTVPKVTHLTWEQLILNQGDRQARLPSGDVVDGEIIDENIKTEGSQSEEHQEG